MNEELSPTAQAVMDAYINAPCGKPRRTWVAAALRAATDQVAPSNYESFTGHAEWDQGMEARNGAIRENLLTIADELDRGVS